MLGLPGFAVVEADEIDAEVELLVETTGRRAWCTVCGVVAESHGRRELLVRDRAVFGRPARLRWRKRLWRCQEQACTRRTWTEQHPAVAPRATLTDRAGQAACLRVGKHGESVAAVARSYGVGWHTVMRGRCGPTASRWSTTPPVWTASPPWGWTRRPS